MPVFRKRPKGFVSSFAEPELIRSLETIEEIVNGSPFKKEVLVPMSADDYHLKHPICHEEFTLGQQLRAGVPIKDVSTSTLLDSSDNLDYEQNEYAEEKVLEALENEEKK